MAAKSILLAIERPVASEVETRRFGVSWLLSYSGNLFTTCPITRLPRLFVIPKLLFSVTSCPVRMFMLEKFRLRTDLGFWSRLDFCALTALHGFFGAQTKWFSPKNRTGLLVGGVLVASIFFSGCQRQGKREIILSLSLKSLVHVCCKTAKLFVKLSGCQMSQRYFDVLLIRREASQVSAREKSEWRELGWIPLPMKIHYSFPLGKKYIILIGHASVKITVVRSQVPTFCYDS